MDVEGTQRADVMAALNFQQTLMNVGDFASIMEQLTKKSKINLRDERL